MFARRLQILADGEEIDAGGAQIVHDLHDLVAAFAEADHQAGFGEALRIQFLGAFEQAQAGIVARAGPHLEIEPRHGFEIVVEDVRRRLHQMLERARPCAGSPASGFRSSCRGLEARMALMVRRKWSAPPSARSSRSTEVMTTWRRPSLSTALGHVLRFGRVQRFRHARPDVAEGTGPRAGVAHDHHGGVPVGPAFADIRTAGLFTHRGQVEITHRSPGFRNRRRCPEP